MPSLLLQRDAKPFIVLNQQYAQLPWNTGLFLKIRSGASHTILTSNAVTYFRNDPLNDLASAGWQKFSCTQTDDSLCRHSPELDLFNARVVQEPYTYSEVLRQEYRLGTEVCSKNTGRQLGSVYTVSMCDLIDTRAQFVLLESTDKQFMFLKTDSTSITEYALLACVCLYAVATLAKHGILLVKADDHSEIHKQPVNPIMHFIPQSILKYMRMSILHVALGLYIALAVLLDMSSIATRNESWLAWYLVFYVLWDCVFCISKLSHNLKEELKQINVMVVLLMMCCLRLYHTFQNVFHVLLTGMFAIRTWCKLLLVLLINSNPQEPDSRLLACNLSVIYDVLTLYLLLLCLNHTTESDFHSQMLDSSILVIGIQLGSVIALIHKCK
jgi:hypothetical protein